MIYMGSELEAFVSATAGGKPVEPARLPGMMQQRHRETRPYLDGFTSSGLFSTNGSRHYIDFGSGVNAQQYEISSPECADPFEAATYAIANERLVFKLLQETGAEYGMDVSMFRTNVDPSGWRSLANAVPRLGSKACHESYSFDNVNTSILHRQLAPFLIARDLLIGAGGFSPCAAGLVWTNNPRLHCLSLDVSHEVSANANRGLLHIGKNESLSIPGRGRCHLVSGMPVSSHTAVALKFSLTAAAVLLIESGVLPAENIRIKGSLLAAAKTLAADPTGTASIELESGARITGIEILKQYLHLSLSRRLADWVVPSCELALKLLGALERFGTMSLSRTLDLYIRHALYTQLLEQRGFNWDAVAAVSSVYEDLCNAYAQALGKGCDTDEKITLDTVLQSKEMDGDVARLTERLSDAGFGWPDVERLIATKTEILAYDLQFVKMGDGTFDKLDQQGILRHRLPQITEEAITRAMERPPKLGRARVRGEFVAKYGQAATRSLWAADWCGIYSLADKKVMRLPAPEIEDAQWEPLQGHEKERATADCSPPANGSNQAIRVLAMAAAAGAERVVREHLPQVLRHASSERGSTVFFPLFQLAGALFDNEILGGAHSSVVRLCLKIAERTGMRRMVAVCLNDLALSQGLDGDYREALQLIDQSLAEWTRLGREEPERSNGMLNKCHLMSEKLTVESDPAVSARLLARVRKDGAIAARILRLNQDWRRSKKLYRLRAQCLVAEGRPEEEAQAELDKLRRFCERHHIKLRPRETQLVRRPTATAGTAGNGRAMRNG